MITLRKLCVEDVAFMLRLVHDSETTKYVPGLIDDPAMMRSWILDLGPDDHEYIVSLTENGTPIGECSLTMRGTIGEIGIMLLSSHWGKGYGTETISCLVEAARSCKAEEVVATTDAENGAMIHILEKLGFYRQQTGWMLRIREDEAETPGMQTVVQYGLKL